jgi:hypothetical protein
MEEPAMKEAAIRERLSELFNAMAVQPAGTVAKPDGMEGVYLHRMTSQDESVEESLDHLRVQLKYLLFDLEATRRENRYLRQMLEHRRRPDMDEHKGESNEF